MTTAQKHRITCYAFIIVGLLKMWYLCMHLVSEWVDRWEGGARRPCRLYRRGGRRLDYGVGSCHAAFTSGPPRAAYCLFSSLMSSGNGGNTPSTLWDASAPSSSTCWPRPHRSSHSISHRAIFPSAEYRDGNGSVRCRCWSRASSLSSSDITDRFPPFFLV